MVAVGERIKKLRIQKGLSQDELAIKMGYKTRSSINKIEKGANTLPFNKLEKLANILGTTTEYLIHGTNTNTVFSKINAINEYNYPYEFLYFPKEYKQELYKKIIEQNKDNQLPKNFSIYANNNDFWQAINFFDLEYDEEKLIDVRIDKYYVDTTVLTPEQQTELNILIKQYIGLLVASGIDNEENKKEMRKLITISYIKSLGKN